MDGGGRLDQPLRRSGPKAAGEASLLVDEPRRSRAENRSREFGTHRFAWSMPYRRIFGYGLIGRLGLRLVRLPPPGVGITASILLLAGTLSYGAVAGGHVTDVVDWLKDARDGAANAIGFRIAAVSL